MLPRGSSNRGARGARSARANDSGATRPRGRGRGSSKTVRFASPPEQSNIKASSLPSIATDSTTPRNTNLQFGAPSATGGNASLNPFAAPLNPFASTSTTTAKSTPGNDQFARQAKVNVATTNPFGAPATTAQSSSIFGAPSGLNGVSKPSPLRNFFTARNTTVPSGSLAPPATNLFSAKPQLSVFSTSSTNVASAIATTLQQQGIVAPPWPESRDKSAMEAFWKAMKAYRIKARAALIRAGLLDDPDKPKKLSEAIDFKGTCEGMCPEFEKINRIIEHDVQGPEKEHTLQYGYEPSPPLMVKALARSAAGQDAPLPEDIRSPAALRRTLDYLIDNLLQSNDLPDIHGFLWDRTRAIRRDFVFQQSSMNSQELLDQVYCLENITRFHVIALHQMSGKDVAADDFSEQQEVEQLGKALLSLIHAYEDCSVQSVACENEKEFRAYYTLFNSHNTGILEAVQDWGWKYWGESDEIQIAVCLVEALQNIWDTHGPLKPHSTTDIAQNAYHRFLSVIEDRKVSYTMACFAEIHFNKVRKASLKAILVGYRKQRDQTKDWTLQRLNTYLRFDDEQEIVTFGEAYGLQFEDIDGDICLSFDSDDTMADPFPQLKQYHSKTLVERKRGFRKLPEVIHHSVFEETACDEGMFVPESPSVAKFGQSVKSQPPDLAPQKPDNEEPLPIPNAIPFLEESRPTSQNSSQPFVSPFSFLSQKPAPTPNDTKLTTTGTSQQTVADPSDGNGESSSTTGAGPQTLVKSTFSFLGLNKTAPAPTIQNQNNIRPLALKPETEPPGFSRFGSNSTPESSLPRSKLTASTSVSQPSVQLPASSLLSIGTPGQPPDTHSLKPPDFISVKSLLKGSTLKDGPQVDNFNFNNKSAPDSRVATVESSVDVKTQMLAFANWIALGEQGLIDQFIEVTVENILSSTIAKHHAEEAKVRLEYEERLAREEVERFRYRTLAKKYVHKWRQIAHRLWLRRKGREAREARRRMAEKRFQESKATRVKSVIDEFRATGNGRRRGSLEQMLLDTGVLDGVRHVDGRIRDIVERKDSRSNENSNSSGTPKSVNSKGQNRSKSVHSQQGDVRRKDALPDSYLQGGSRIHLIPNYSPDTEGRRQLNGVQTDYFRLKARGITTLSNGTPLANTAAVHLPNQSHSFNGRSKSTTPERLVIRKIDDLSVVKGQDDIEALKARAKAIISEDDDTHQSKKRLLDDNDDELFAKAKRIREQMDEGAEWFRIEMQKSISRSVS